jgi:hypothetical protein
MTILINNPNWLKMRSDVYLRDKGICWICNEFVELNDYELGHLVDRCMNGVDDYNNVAVMHQSCNLSKPHHSTLEETLKWKLTFALRNRQDNYSPTYIKSISWETRKKRIIKQRKIPNSKPYAQNNEQQTLDVKPLTITWVQGKTRWLIPPREDGSYYSEDKYTCGWHMKIEGSVRQLNYNEYNPAQSTIEIIGNTNNISINTTIYFGIYITKKMN